MLRSISPGYLRPGVWLGARLGMPTTLRIALMTAWSLPLICGCSGPDSREQMKIERQITISKSHAVSPQLIARTPDDGYIIAGSDNEQRTEAWAARLTSSGDAVWEYLDGSPGSWADSHPGTNRFSGAVVLRDNTVLLCGGKNVDNMPHGLLVHIGADGSVIEQRNV